MLMSAFRWAIFTFGRLFRFTEAGALYQIEPGRFSRHSRVAMAATAGKTQGWRRTTVMLLNGDIFTCSYDAITVNHGLPRLNSKCDQERLDGSGCCKPSGQVVLHN